MTNLEYLQTRCRNYLVQTIVEKVAETKVCRYGNLPYDYNMFIECLTIVAYWLDEEHVDDSK